MSRSYSRRTWRGHWLLTLALLVLTLAGAGVAADKLPRTYQAQGSVVLLASRAVSRSNGGNPYLSFSPSLTLTADVLSRELMAPATVTYLASMGYTGSYTVALAPDTVPTTGSVLLLTVAGSDRATVVDTLAGVIDELRTRLGHLQAGIAKFSQIRVEPLSVSSQATVSMAQTLRPLAALLALGLAATFGIPWFIDAQIAERRARRAAAQEASTQEAAAPQPEGRRQDANGRRLGADGRWQDAGDKPQEPGGRPAEPVSGRAPAATPRPRSRASGR